MDLDNKYCYWINFPYKSALPSKEILSNWISVLALITNDLTLTNKNLIKEFDSNQLKGSPEVSYYLWLTCSHYREAAKFLIESINFSKISSFIDSLPKSTRDQFKNMEKDFEPWENSLLKTIIKPIRDTFIHYPVVNSEDWESIWETLETERGELHQRGLAIGDSRWIFADDIRNIMIIKSIEDSGYSIEEVISLLSKVVVNMITFTQTVIIKYFDDLREGIIVHGKKTNS